MHQKKSPLNTMLFLTLTLLCTTALLLMPIQTQAASKRTKKQAQRAYRNFLYESDYRSFKLIDMNRDGLKELVVSYEDSQTMVSQIIAYTYKDPTTIILPSASVIIKRQNVCMAAGAVAVV